MQPLSYEEFKKARRTGNSSTTLVKFHQGNTTRLLSIEEIKELQAKNGAEKEIRAKQGVLMENGERKRDATDKLVARQDPDLDKVFFIFEHDRACDQLDIDSVAGRTTLDTKSQVQVGIGPSEEVETPTNQVYVDDDERESCPISNFGTTPVPDPSRQNLSLKVSDDEDEAKAAVSQFKDNVRNDESPTGRTPRIFLLSLKKSATFKGVLKAGRKAIERKCSSKVNERSTSCLCTPSNSAPFLPASISVASIATSSSGANIGIGAIPVPRVNLYGANSSTGDDHDDSPPQSTNSNIVVDSVAVDEEDASSLIAEAVRHDGNGNKVVLVVTPRNHAVGAAREDALFTSDCGMSINNLQATPLQIMQVEGGYLLSPDSTAPAEVENIFRCLSGSGSSIGSTLENEPTQASTFDNLTASPPTPTPLLDTELVFTSSEDGEEASPIESRKQKKNPTLTLDSKKSAGIVTVRVSDINRQLARLSSEAEYTNHRVSRRLGNNQQYIRSVPIGIAKTKSRDSVGTTVGLPLIKSFEGQMH